MTGPCQAPLSMEFSRQVYWSGSPFPSPGDLPNPGIKPTSPALGSRFFTTETPGKPIEYYSIIKRNECESVLVRWMNLEPVIPSEVRKRKNIV